MLSDGCGETKVVLLRQKVAWVSVISPTWHRRTFPSTLQWARRRRRCIDRPVKCTQSAPWIVEAASPILAVGMAQWRSWGNQDRPPATNKILTGKFGCCLSPNEAQVFIHILFSVDARYRGMHPGYLDECACKDSQSTLAIAHSSQELKFVSQGSSYAESRYRC